MNLHEMNDSIRVLIADDHPVIRSGLRALIETEPGRFCQDSGHWVQLAPDPGSHRPTFVFTASAFHTATMEKSGSSAEF